MASPLPKRPLRGILKKKSAAPADPSADPASRSTAPHTNQRLQTNAEKTALKHASIIQDRKNLEEAIFNSILRLIDFPLVRESSVSSAKPAPSDAVEFKSLVRIFQPSDYDDLIEERNTCGLCGYSLCAEPRRVIKGGGEWKLVNAGRKDFDIVPKKELEKWCSSECARRALYIKVQLNETAAWERVGLPEIRVELMGESETPSGTDAQLASSIKYLKIDDENKTVSNAASLALERGDVGGASLTRSVDVTILEHKVVKAPEEPILNPAEPQNSSAHLILEGYQTRFDLSRPEGSTEMRSD